MTEKEKQLLLNDLCARLPYGVRVHLVYDDNMSFEREMGIGSLHDIMFDNVVSAKPYLRPMSSMTEEEKADYHFYCETVWDSAEERYYHYDTFKSIDWLNEHHFDYRGLIEKGLALEASEGMYKTN